MKAIILAAGYGNRMRPLTDNKHKTLLKIGDKAIIERIIDGLVENEVSRIVVVTGYRAEELTSFLVEAYPNVEFAFVHNDRYHETNNIFSMALAFDSSNIDEDIILIESDLIYEPKVIKRAIKSNYPNVALVDKWRSGMDGTVVSVSGNIITHVIPTHLQGVDFDFSDKYKTLNIYKFSEGFCNAVFKKLLTYYARAINDNCYYELVLGMLIYMQQETIYAEILDGERWAEVDDPNDLRVAEFIFNTDERKSILENTFGGYWSHEVLDFCFIRNMYFPNSSMLSEMRNNLQALLANYGSKQDVLNQKLAYFLLCRKEQVNALNGASQIYPILGRFFNTRKVLVPDPTFGEYRRVFPSCALYPDKVGIELADLEDRSGNADVVVVVNPNNPTGTAIPTRWIVEFAQRHESKTVIVDESFIDFSRYDSVVTSLEADPLRNVIVIKSLSKALGIPGLRLGYVYSCDQNFNAFVRDAIPIWNLNSLAEYLLEIILKHRKALQQSYASTVKDREELAGLLSRLKFVEKVYESDANFLLVSLKTMPMKAADVVNHLLCTDSLYIKDVTDKFSNGRMYFRFAVRLPDENKLMVESLKRCVAHLCLGPTR